MLAVGLRDLQFRRRRFLISIIAVALVFGLSLVLTGLALSFDTEIDRTLNQVGATAYVVPTTASGPYFAITPMLQPKADEIAKVPGVTAAAPIAFRPMHMDSPVRKGVNAFGIVPGQLGSPPLADGRLPANETEAVVDKRLGLALGTKFAMAGNDYTVVGLVDHSSLLGGSPNVFLTLKGLQAVAYGAQPVINSVAITGTPQNLPQGFKVVDINTAHADLLQPIEDARGSIYLMMAMLWLVAAAIVASVIFLSASERMPEFAVFKAMGISSSKVVVSLVVQSAIVALLSVVVAVGIGYAVAPLFPIPVEIPTQAIVMVFIAGLVIGMLASLAAVRKALSVDPALAFG